MIRKYRRSVLVLAATLLVAIAAVAGLAVKGSHHASAQQLIAAKLASRDARVESQGTANGGQGGESAELLAAMQQFDNARTAPGDAVAPGGYSPPTAPAEPRAHSGLWAAARLRMTPTSGLPRLLHQLRQAPPSPGASPALQRTTTVTCTPRRRRRRLALDDRAATGRRSRTRSRRSSGDLGSPDESLVPRAANTSGTAMRHRRLPPREPDHGHVRTERPGRRQRARIDDDQLDPLHVDRRVDRNASGSVLAAGRELLGPVDAAPAAEPELPARRRERRCAELGRHEHRERRPDRPEELTAPPGRPRVAQRPGVQRLLRVDRRR